MPTTYCNPLPIPNYPVGRLCRTVAKGDPVDDSQWLLETKEQFRELADPSALWHEGRWYLYPSVDMAYVSADAGATWQHHPLNIRDVGYAPTIVRHRGRFLLLASGSAVYAAPAPLGPFTELGVVRLPKDARLPAQGDPMLFADADGRLYYYWGCSPAQGIYGVELDASDPTRPVGKPVHLIPFRPDLHVWERAGDWNEDPNVGWLEGAWMYRRDGTYYLTYAAAGTENRTYAMGCYKGPAPLGPFVPQKHNPILRGAHGLVTGTSHGCIADGPDGSTWVFYTVRAGHAHRFERRIGMDPAGIDAHGELYVTGPSCTPQRLVAAAAGAADAGWLPLNIGMRTIGSSTAANLPGRLAVDEDLRTWWQPADADPSPTLTTELRASATVHAVRIVWRDIGLETSKGAPAGPFQYRVDVEAAKGRWVTLLDRSDSREDFLIDYRECPPTAAAAARLVVTGWPRGIRPGVAEFTLFGQVVQGA
jgi:hypothetical protein